MDQEDVDVVQPLDRDKGITLEDFKFIKMQMASCTRSFILFNITSFYPDSISLVCNLLVSCEILELRY